MRFFIVILLFVLVVSCGEQKDTELEPPVAQFVTPKEALLGMMRVANLSDCDIPDDEYFEIECHGYSIEISKGHEFSKNMTKVMIHKRNTSYEDGKLTIENIDEYNSIIDTSKSKTLDFLNDTFKGHQFKFVDAVIGGEREQWSETNKEVSGIHVKYIKTIGGIGVLGSGATFMLDKNQNYDWIELYISNIPNKKVDKNLINKLDKQNKEIKELLKENNPDISTGATYGYFVFRDGPELVFLIRIYNGYYIVRAKDYDGTYESLKNNVVRDI